MAGPQVEHIVKSYDQELSRLRGLITQMGGLVESQAANATRAVIEHDVQAATFAVQDDPQVDALEREIEQFAIRLLALNRLEQSFEISLAEAATTLALNDLEKQGRAIFYGTGKDLQHVTLIVTINQDAELL